MSVRLSCPSCNTAFDLPAVPPDRRAACPRCGDVFPVRGDVAESAATLTPPPVAPATLTPPPVRGWSIWKVAAVGGLLALLGFGAGLAVYWKREAPPRGEPQPEPAVAVGVTPPAQLAGLGYLPAECNAVFAVQPGPVLEYAARTGQTPRDLLAKAGLPGALTGALEGAGVSLPQVDHLAGGLFLPSGPEEFRAAVVLVLKRPLPDEAEFLKRLKAKPAGKGRYAVELAGVPLAPTLARVSPTVWVFGLNPADLAAADRGGFGPGGTHFRGGDTDGLRKMLASVPVTAAAWLAADDDREWADKPVVKLLARSEEAKRWLPAVAGGRGVVLAASYGEQPRMRVFVRTAETAAADRLRAYFQARAAEVEGATAGGGGTFALFDAPADAALVRRMLADAGK